MLQKLVKNKEREKERKLEKGVSVLGTLSGAGSVLGSWQVCHTVCLGIIAALGMMGITLTFMPLGFLTTIAQPLWFIAVLLLIITGILYFTRRCLSGKMLLLQSGLLIAGVPFTQDYALVWWIAGGAIAGAGVIAMIWERIRRRLQRRQFHETKKFEKKCDKCH